MCFVFICLMTLVVFICFVLECLCVLFACLTNREDIRDWLHSTRVFVNGRNLWMVLKTHTLRTMYLKCGDEGRGL